YGIRFCREAIVVAGEAVAAAERIGYPVVVKADAAGLTHKTEAGGICLDVADAAAVRAACAALRARTGAERFVVQERVGPGVELLLGARRDEVFGPVVVFGAGGVLTEVLRDVSVRLAPLAEGEAEGMLAEGAPAGGPAPGLEATDPANQRLAGGGIHEKVLGLEPHLAEIAAELRHECRPDGRLPAADGAGELLVDRVLGHERHHALEVVLVERVGEPDHQAGERRAIHGFSYTIGRP